MATTSVFAQTPKKATPAKASALARPKLVVGIVVDQMRYDYLYRYYDQYTEGGFKRMMNEGFNCRNNHYSYALTVTAAGHASAYTGSIPAINGIVGNEWYDPIAKQDVYCVEDSTVKTVGSNNVTVGKMSPRNLLVSTITDQLRIATNFRSKTIGVAIKDRGSILPAGHAANAAYWFDSKTGNWVTSTYYMDDLPQWAKDYNAKKMPAEYLKKGWELLLPAEAYTQSSPDDVAWEGKLPGAKRPVFPYELMGMSGDAFGIVTDTPWGNTITKEMAIEAIKGEQLGKGKDTDFLAISFSSTDKIGHRAGPNSIEQQDDFLRLDREFADLFNFLDGWVGKGQYTVFLTADHGVVDVPGFAQEHKLPAGLVDRKLLTGAVTEALNEAFGKDKYVVATDNNQLYFDHSLLRKKNITIAAVHAVVRDAALAVPGIADVIDLHDMGKAPLNTYQLELYKNNVNAKRSGDLQVISQPGWFYGTSTGTSHGTPYNYDTQVPFVMFGWGINKGETVKRTSVSDIAPTIAALLHILPGSGNIGLPVEEALKK
ncbi:alkaline phosphatase PafA [Dyadobacter fermentans]|uniref:Type I phosphodiesterase/nucleotide pyrophosphatase n=1 Tax=Dyadobacter fermentans (strain ATCC 700827 / DSM 18053 / CIP 107007 / KCTC 52180 / NS114) TaxID=471854 RepID=C6W5K3_DYAFD|nr:alkaline phosphatase PafA [Dyadobacter fermentans]ACT94221.1 type I phosphodiesterase/nucleotide pyrophosphatase [Dyadobacter fermentans DSM 18053]